MTLYPDLPAIQAALNRIRPYIHRTPVLTSSSINRMLGAEFYFKCENFQKVGAFKYRGATNAILSLTREELAKGVGTHSSGNHAAALALAAATAGVPAYIVMPRNAPEIKKAAVDGYGAQIFFCEPTQQAREARMREVQEETGCTFIHPYDRYEIIAGQGTAALELMEEVPGLEIIMAPVGGGGLLSGTAIAAKGLDPDIRVWAGEPEMANDAWKSFYTGELHPSIQPQTIADGLLTSLSQRTLAAIREHVDAILLCPERLIIEALTLILQRMKIVIEPSSAVPLGALLAGPEKHWKGKKIGIILSGGNLDITLFARQAGQDPLPR